MSNILSIHSSLRSGDGMSSRLAQELVDHWIERHPDATHTVRDLAADPVPHLDAMRFGAFIRPEGERSEAEREVVAYSDRLIDEIRQADAIVLTAPMYNFAIPSTLKAYFDHIARAGVTFRYGEQGPEGLLGGRPVYVVTTRGGRYRDTPLDTQSGYLRDFLAFVGLTDVRFIYAEGLAMSAVREESLRDARAAIATTLELEQPLAA